MEKKQKKIEKKTCGEWKKKEKEKEKGKKEEDNFGKKMRKKTKTKEKSCGEWKKKRKNMCGMEKKCKKEKKNM